MTVSRYTCGYGVFAWGAGEVLAMSLEISPIADAEMDAVASFLHRNLNNRLSVSEWLSAMSVPWKADAPNSGFMLRDGEHVVGVYLAFY